MKKMGLFAWALLGLALLGIFGLLALGPVTLVRVGLKRATGSADDTKNFTLWRKAGESLAEPQSATSDDVALSYTTTATKATDVIARAHTA